MFIWSLKDLYRESDRRSAKRRQSQRLSSFKVTTIVLSKQIKTRTELLTLTSKKHQKAEAKKDLVEFIINRGTKVVEEVIATVWDVENASEVLERSKLSRVEIMEKVLDNPCNKHCNRRWLQCAKQLLTWNDISIGVFTKAVRNLLEEGRGQHRNILIKGPANTGKTFHTTVKVYFKVFNFAWQRLQRFANCIFFLNNCFLCKKEC